MAEDDDKKREDREGAAAVLHYIRGDRTFTENLIQDYSGGDGHRLYFAFLRLAANFADVLASEQNITVAEVFENLPVEERDVHAAEVVKLSATKAPTETFVTALVGAGGSDPEFCFNLIRVNIAILNGISALGGKPKHGVDGSPESWMERYVLWIAGDEPPDKGYTYERDDPKPCYVCGDDAFGRDPQGRPHHVGCTPTDE